MHTRNKTCTTLSVELTFISWRHIFRQIQNKNHKLHAEIRHWRDKHNPPWNFEMRRSPENIAEPL